MGIHLGASVKVSHLHFTPINTGAATAAAAVARLVRAFGATQVFG